MLSLTSCHRNQDNLRPWGLWITLSHLSYRKHRRSFLSSWSSRGLWIGKTLDTGTKIWWPVKRHARARKVFTSSRIWNHPWGKRQRDWWIVGEKLLKQKPHVFILQSWKRLFPPWRHIVTMKIAFFCDCCCLETRTVTSQCIWSPVKAYSHLATRIMCHAGIF